MAQYCIIATFELEQWTKRQDIIAIPLAVLLLLREKSWMNHDLWASVASYLLMCEDVESMFYQCSIKKVLSSKFEQNVSLELFNDWFISYRHHWSSQTDAMRIDAVPEKPKIKEHDHILLILNYNERVCTWSHYFGTKLEILYITFKFQCLLAMPNCTKLSSSIFSQLFC